MARTSRPLNADSLPEIVFGSSDASESRRVGRLVRAGRLRKLAPRLYTSDLHGEPEGIVRRNWVPIVAHFFPGAVVSHRSAFAGGQPEDGTVFITTDRSTDLRLPGLFIRAAEGPGPLPGDMGFPMGLHLASEPRLLLENLQPSRSRKSIARTVPQAEIERRLDRLCEIRGPEELNRLRDTARELAPQLGPHVSDAELPKLERIIGALLGTQPADTLTTPAGQARAAGMPYDTARVELFNRLQAALNRAVFPERPFDDRGDAWVNAAFFDAYFSNYIEGTEFLPEEAADIVFHGRLLDSRPEDSHDILGTYRVVSARGEFRRRPNSFESFEDLLRQRHAIILQGRPHMRPGVYKERGNRAGGTVFVDPGLVRGTLQQGFAFYSALQHPFARAVYMMFLVAEVHPFADGNSRIARAMMNAELVAENQSRILVPTVYREDYLTGLRDLTRNGQPDALIRMLGRAWEFADQLEFADYDTALATLRACNAFEEPSAAKLVMPNEPKAVLPGTPER